MAEYPDSWTWWDLGLVITELVINLAVSVTCIVIMGVFWQFPIDLKKVKGYFEMVAYRSTTVAQLSGGNYIKGSGVKPILDICNNEGTVRT